MVKVNPPLSCKVAKPFCNFRHFMYNKWVHQMREGDFIMAESGGKADKGRKEQKKKPKLTIKEKRKVKHEKKENKTTI